MSHSNSAYYEDRGTEVPDTMNSRPELDGGSPVRRTISSTSLPPHIDISSLPGGLPILGPFFGYTNGFRFRYINERLNAFNVALGRPLTIPEEQAVAWHSATAFRIMSYGPVIGVVFGLGRWRMTMENMQLLGVGKLYDEAVNKKWRAYFESGEQRPPWTLRWENGKLWAGDRELLRSITNPARKMAVVQGFRALPYVSLGYFFSTLVTRIWAQTAMAVGESLDSRLEVVGANLKERAENAQAKQAKAPASSSRFGSRNTYEANRSPGNEVPNESSQRRRGGIGPGTSDATRRGHDDASPTSNNDFFQDMVEEEPRPVVSEPDDARSKRNGRFQRSSQDNSFNKPEQQGVFQQERYERQAPSRETSFDDASPTGGAGLGGYDDQDQGGSAWDRIRQNSSSRNTSNNFGEDGAQNSDQYQQRRRQDDDLGYSRSEEEKSYARSEAQKEFDARVEMERKGGNF